MPSPKKTHETLNFRRTSNLININYLGRINELLSSIRMQYEGDMRPISGPTGSLDSTAIADIQKHLKVSPFYEPELVPVRVSNVRPRFL